MFFQNFESNVLVILMSENHKADLFEILPPSIIAEIHWNDVVSYKSNFKFNTLWPIDVI